ncbi:hypothetical protein HanXRQr2_Chr03g0092921 [Helianthus annuus]|uniref:Uncharacterized protein n=1 Tax=Helianthus annuus TaxID=4232 RepID=A0A251V4H2_HELAN|nr:hypothetical protein HanXRQr2_Chr03g0092921 [Helianthus annuus]
MYVHICRYMCGHCIFLHIEYKFDVILYRDRGMKASYCFYKGERNESILFLS